jgi:hypothetical protein
VAAGQGTLFDLFAAPVEPPVIGPAADGEPAEDEVPRRERLRWEKELLGIYLTEHPLGDIADQLPEYVTAYTGDLAEESDQAKVTLGGIIQSTRRVVTRAGATMLVATLEDLQGSVEVVVFPKVFAETAIFWADDSVVLVSGRVDRRDDAAQILCEAVHAWDDAARMGPMAFGAERDRLLRSRGGRVNWGGGAAGSAPTVAAPAPAGNGGGVGHGTASELLVRPRGAVSVAPVVSPAAPEAPVALPVGPAGPVEASDEAPAPADAVPLSASAPGAGTIEIVFEQGIALDRLLPAIELVTQAVRNRPGGLPVVINIPVAGATRQVRLPHRAEWDERLAESVRQAASVPVAVQLRAASVDT